MVGVGVGLFFKLNINIFFLGGKGGLRFDGASVADNK